ncbi:MULTISPECIES: MFS transporter [Saccharothrix]|uniref:MFS transporter n=1 Tax=Saccharothrix TaxID=2071 RepID=UPI00093A1080|nr:MFS transporter [Saccharothrix sp. CB00851]
MPSRLTTSVAATGLATFALLYAPQSVLPDIAAEFGLTPAEASLAISAATGALALAIIPMAALADRHGRARIALAGLALAAAGAVISLPGHVAAIAVGLTLFTGGFFAAHAVASGWVGARAPEHARGQASGVYLFAFYVGSSTGGTAGSAAYQAYGWPGLIVLIIAWLTLAAVAVVVAQRAQQRAQKTQNAQKSSGTSTPAPPATAASPNCGNVTVPGATDTVAERTSSGTSNTTATGNASPP